MPVGDSNDDDYVASLLKQDAKTSAQKYSTVGLEALLPSSRPRSNAPKPNTRFLRNIIRETDSHNAALLAKEAEESRARLKRMRKEEERRKEGRLTPPRYDERDTGRSSKRRKMGDSEDEEREGEIRRRHRENGSRSERRYRSGDGPGRRDGSSDLDRDRERRREKRSRRHEDAGDGYDRKRKRRSRRRDDSDTQDDDRRERSLRRDRERKRRHGSDSDRSRSRARHESKPSRRHRRHRSYSREAPRSRSRSPSSSKRRSTAHRGRRTESLSPPRNSGPNKPIKQSSRSRRKVTEDMDSDPLEDLVGPLPAPPPPKIIPRGRGAHKASKMDDRFAPDYDPTLDVQPNSDVEDGWGDAVEAFRDRQRWKQQGAERLKAAGFTDAQVKKWEKGDEKTEEDVRWAKKGEGREWDRGKVVDEEGDVDLRADWGRLSPPV